MTIPKPEHQTNLPDLGKTFDWGGYFPDGESAKAYYEDNLDSPYHQDRFRAISELGLVVSREMQERPLKVIDFGIGDALDFVKLDLKVQSLIGIDVSPHMLEIANKNLETFKTKTQSEFSFSLTLGDETSLSDVKSHSIDLVIATNVLGYLSETSERNFWQEVNRILAGDGMVLITVGNLLFDLFALNDGTKDFYEKEFGIQNLNSLVTFSPIPRFINARRHNPLQLQDKLDDIGLSLKSVSFASKHKVPPILLQIRDGLTPEVARLEAREFNSETKKDDSDNRWQSWFRCSIIGLLFQKA